MVDPTGEAIRAACLEAARAAYEDAGIAGLCEEGRWELALDAIRSLDLDAAARRHEAGGGHAGAGNRSEPRREG
jgi:hypothetical protein